MSKPPLHSFQSIAALLRYLGLPGPQHPLIALLQYDRNYTPVGNPGDRISLDFYKISFKTSFSGKVKYGQGYYDFEDGGLAFIAPRQIVAVPEKEDSYEGYALYFHPDLLSKYPLMNTIHHYSFFHYAISEALFLSEKEKGVMERLFTSIAEELQTNIDGFSQDILVAQIEQLLSYSDRFYNRQFITRKVMHNELITKMEQLLADYLSGDKALIHGLPTVQAIADELHVTTHYLSDMLRSLTGQNTQQHIHYAQIEKAKQMLSAGTLSVAEIAYQLGFEYPQSFSKLFKKKTNSTPLAYRQSFN